MNKKGWKTAEKNVSTSFRVLQAPESWSKYTTLVIRIAQRGPAVKVARKFFVAKAKLGSPSSPELEKGLFLIYGNYLLFSGLPELRPISLKQPELGGDPGLPELVENLYKIFTKILTNFFFTLGAVH